MAKTAKSKVKRDNTEVLASALAIILAVLLLICIMVPVLHTVALSFSRGTAELAGQIYLWPVDSTLQSIRSVITETEFLKALFNTMFVTVVGVLFSLVITVLFAYPLSRPSLRGKKFFTLLCIVCMVFKGGMVPTYMVVKSLGLLNSFFSLIFPYSFSIFNMLIVKNYFDNLPSSVMESATIDGAGEFRTLLSIVIPMSTPCIATMGLLYAVAYWNNYFGPALYITEASKITLQMCIRNLIAGAETIVDQVERVPELQGCVSGGTIAGAATIMGVIPILLFYPFIQRYMIGGMTVGSVKE